MSKPWSEAGLAADWAVVVRNYVLALAIAALVVIGLTFECGRRHPAPDPAIARDSTLAAAYHDSLLAERHFNTSLAAAAVIAVARLDSAQRHVDSTGRVAARLTRGIVIDTVARDTGSRAAATAADTTAWAYALRADDTTHYRIPKFIGDGFLALQVHAAALEEDRQAEHSARLIAVAQFVDDSVHRVREWKLADSTHAADQRQIDALKKIGHPWCQAKCGAVLTLAALAASAIALHEVRR